MRTLDFPALRHLLGAYLNRDWPEEYGSIEAAVDAYRREADAARRSSAVSEIDKLLATLLDEAALAEFVGDLGCAYNFEGAPDGAAGFLKMIRSRISP